MKKLFFTFAMFSLTVCQATTFVFDNQMAQGYIDIQMIQTRKGVLNYPFNGPKCVFMQPYLGYFVVNAGQTFYLSDNDPYNKNFPLLDKTPFQGHVTTYGGAVFPIPPCNEGQSIPVNRYTFEYMKFLVKGGYDDGFGPNDGDGNNDVNGNQASKIGPLPYFSGNPSYQISYMRFGSIHYFMLEEF